MRDDEKRGGMVGLVLTAIGAFTLGALTGMAIGGAVGAVHGGRVRDTLGRLGRGARRAPPEELEQAVLAALREDQATSDLDVGVHVVEPGLVELTGVASDATLRRVAGDIVRAVPGVEVVVNRIMLRGTPHLRPV